TDDAVELPFAVAALAVFNPVGHHTSLVTARENQLGITRPGDQSDKPNDVPIQPESCFPTKRSQPVGGWIFEQVRGLILRDAQFAQFLQQRHSYVVREWEAPA